MYSKIAIDFLRITLAIINLTSKYEVRILECVFEYLTIVKNICV